MIDRHPSGRPARPMPADPGRKFEIKDRLLAGLSTGLTVSGAVVGSFMGPTLPGDANSACPPEPPGRCVPTSEQRLREFSGHLTDAGQELAEDRHSRSKIAKELQVSTRANRPVAGQTSPLARQGNGGRAPAAPDRPAPSPASGPAIEKRRPRSRGRER